MLVTIVDALVVELLNTRMSKITDPCDTPSHSNKLGGTPVSLAITAITSAQKVAVSSMPW